MIGGPSPPPAGGPQSGVLVRVTVGRPKPGQRPKSYRPPMTHHYPDHAPEPYTLGQLMPGPLNYPPRPPWWKRNPRRAIALGVIALGAAIAIIAALNRPGLGKIADTCGVRSGDNGATLTINTKGAEETYGDTITDVACVAKETSMTDAVINQIEGTRALDGTQTATWDDYTATWRYHPDNGLTITITED